MNSSVRAQIDIAFDKYLCCYFKERNAEGIWELFSENLTGFGTGLDEIGMFAGDLFELYKRDFADAPQPFEYNIRQRRTVSLTENFGVVNAVLDIQGIVMEQPLQLLNLRLSAVFQKDEGNWLMSHMHISFPASEHGPGESYPLADLEKRNELLQTQVQEKTRDLMEKNRQLEDALGRVKSLSGLLPICAWCHKVRKDDGYWLDVAEFIRLNSDADCSHSICPECLTKHYPEVSENLELSVSGSGRES